MSDAEAPAQGWSRRLLSLARREWGVPAGLAAGLAALRATGANPFGYPTGHDWNLYIANAAWIWADPRPEAIAWSNWRGVGQAWLMGLFGEHIGYITAAQWITYLSMVSVIACAALLARALGSGGWPALVAGLIAGLLPPVRAGVAWVNCYPLIAGASGLALAAGAQTLRSRRWEWAALTGFAAAFVVTVDVRGYGPFLIAAGLVFLSLFGPGGMRRRGALALAALIPAAGVFALQHHVIVTRDAASIGILEQATLNSAEGLHYFPEDCEPDSPNGLVRLTSRCGKAHRDRGIVEMRPQGLPPPELVLVLLALTLLPGRGGWRATLGAVGTLWGPAVLVFVGMHMVSYTDRFLLLMCTPLAALFPVAAYRLGDTAWALLRLIPPLRERRWPAALGATALTAIFAVAFIRQAEARWPDPLASLVKVKRGPARGEDQRWMAARMIAAWAKPGDLVADCANVDVFENLLPLPGELLRSPHIHGDCPAWMLDAPSPGDAWLVAPGGYQVPDRPQWTFMTEVEGVWEGGPLWIYRRQGGAAP